METGNGTGVMFDLRTAKERSMVRTAAGKRDGSVKSNTLPGSDRMPEALTGPVWSMCIQKDEVIEPFKQGWIYNWEKNDWTNAKGRSVQCADQWQEAKLLLSEHSVRFMKMEDDKQ